MWIRKVDDDTLKCWNVDIPATIIEQKMTNTYLVRYDGQSKKKETGFDRHSTHQTSLRKVLAKWSFRTPHMMMMMNSLKRIFHKKWDWSRLMSHFLTEHTTLALTCIQKVSGSSSDTTLNMKNSHVSLNRNAQEFIPMHPKTIDEMFGPEKVSLFL